MNVTDSLGLLSDQSPNTILQIAKLDNTNKSFFTVQKLSVQQQTETSDCGLFAIAFAVETCLKMNVELVSFKQVAVKDEQNPWMLKLSMLPVVITKPKKIGKLSMLLTLELAFRNTEANSIL